MASRNLDRLVSFFGVEYDDDDDDDEVEGGVG